MCGCIHIERENRQAMKLAAWSKSMSMTVENADHGGAVAWHGRRLDEEAELFARLADLRVSALRTSK
jgi:hypothetical protein